MEQIQRACRNDVTGKQEERGKREARGKMERHINYEMSDNRSMAFVKCPRT